MRIKYTMGTSNPSDSLRVRELTMMKQKATALGIEDLMAVYGEYRELIDLAETYLCEIWEKFTFSTTDRSI